MVNNAHEIVSKMDSSSESGSSGTQPLPFRFEGRGIKEPPRASKTLAEQCSLFYNRLHACSAAFFCGRTGQSREACPLPSE